MKRLLFALLIIASLVLAPTAAFAQDELPIACGDLSEEDCDFLKESRDALAEVPSSASVVEMQIDLANLPNLPAELGLNLMLDGQFQMDPELNARGQELQLMMSKDPAAVADEIIAFVLDIYAEIGFNLGLDLSISDDLADLLSAQSGGAPVPSALGVDARMADGFLYFNLDDVGAAVGDPSVAGWVGMDIAGMMAKSFEMMEEEGGAMPMDPMSMVAGQMQSQMALAETAVDYTDVERLDDVEVDGVEAAQFLYTFDLAGFVTSPEFGEMLKAQIAMQMAMQESMGQDPGMAEADVQMGIDMLPMIAPMLLGDFSIESISTIGLEDKLVYASETNMAWDLTSVATMASTVMGLDVARPARGADAPTFTLTMTSQSSAHGEAFEVEIPEDVQIVPIDAMMEAQD